MIRDSEFSNTEIKSLIVKNVLSRNSFIEQVINMLNSIESNAYISLDANWGEGKTTFVKQLEYLSTSGLEATDIGDLKPELVEDFQKKYTVFYYNAWKNDHHTDPLQSILFNMIGDLYAEEELIDRANALTANAVKSVVKQSVKVLSNNIINIEDINNVETMKDLVKEITTSNKRVESVSKIIETILPKGRKLLFIVDELDRCTPNFAVGILETIKHYYNNDNSIFLLATNNRQLVHTIRKHYGEGFNAPGYLDKFYDLEIDLEKIKIKDYIHKHLKVDDDSYYINIMPREIAIYLKLSPRETNRYISTISLVQDSLNAEISKGYQVEMALTSAVFIPFALALRIKDKEKYDLFVNGNGEDIVKDLTENLNYVQRIVEKGEKNPSDAVNDAIKIYKDLMNVSKQPYDRSNDIIREAYDSLMRILPIINVAGLIDKKFEDPKKIEK